MPGDQCGDVMRYLCTNWQPAGHLQLVLQAWVACCTFLLGCKPTSGYSQWPVRRWVGRLLSLELVNRDEPGICYRRTLRNVDNEAVLSMQLTIWALAKPQWPVAVISKSALVWSCVCA